MKNTGIYLFDDVEVLDFAGPFEVFSVTSELNNFELLKVFTISKNGQMIKAVNGLNIQPDHSFDSHPEIDILIIPGGAGTRTEMKDDSVLQWVKNNFDKSEITFSVCSGSRILGTLGLLDGIESVTHHEVIEDMKAISPAVIIKENARFADNGKIMTSGGISAGIDLSLHVIKKLFGKEIMNKTIKYMEYGNWEEI